MTRQDKIEVVCFCGESHVLTEREFAEGMIECSECECELDLADDVETQLQWNVARKEECDLYNRASHVRLMLRGEDHSERCLKNGIPNSLGYDLLDLIVAGAQQSYPEGRVWLEDEESTNPRYIRSLMSELD